MHSIALSSRSKLSFVDSNGNLHSELFVQTCMRGAAPAGALDCLVLLDTPTNFFQFVKWLLHIPAGVGGGVEKGSYS